MKLSLRLLPAVLLSSALSSPVLAQIATAPPRSALESARPLPPGNPEKRYERHHEFANRFADYLKSHPDVHGDLTNNPKLIHDKAYMKAHPDLRNTSRNIRPSPPCACSEPSPQSS